ncbi:MAG: SBBP repeat-containing protein [Ignavibacteria bacterium]
MAVDNSGNVYVTGGSFGSGTAGDYSTIKYNSSGIQQWEARYNGPGNSYDNAYSIAVDNSGNVYVTGSSLDGLSDYATIKYNSSGVQQWAQRYDGPASSGDDPRSLAVDDSGNVYVTGSSFGVNGTGFDYATIKYNSSGVQQWAQRYNSPGNESNDNAWSLAVDTSGNVYVTGGSGTVSDYATIKYNSAGVEQWVQRYNGPGNGGDYTYSLALDASGNVYVTGGSNSSSGSGTEDYATIKYNSSGVEQWVQRYNGPGNGADIARSLAVDNSGNVYVTGHSFGNGTSNDYATIKYNSSGVQQWVQRYNGPGNVGDIAISLAVDISENVYITGVSSSDYATIKYNSSGVEQWVQRYNGPGNDFDNAYSLALDASGNVYVTGFSTGIGTEKDYATIKYSQQVGIQLISNEIPNQFSLSQNYPNPFNPKTVINYELRVTGNTELKVFNVLGNEVSTLVNEKQNAGSYQVEFDGSNLTSGVYFYKIEAGEFVETKRMLLIK